MIKLEDLKVGDYVGSLWGNGVATVKKINKKSFTTTTGLTIYENEFKDCFVITEEQARASAIHNLNEELKEMDKLLKKLQEKRMKLNSSLNVCIIFILCPFCWVFVNILPYLLIINIITNDVVMV